MSIGFLTAFMLALAPAEEPSQEELLKKIQGRWEVVAEAIQGPPEKIFASHVTVEKDKFELHTPTGVARFEIKRMRKGEIDFVAGKGRPVVGDELPAIYDFDGEIFRICICMIGPKSTKDPPPRPTRFLSPEDSDYRVYVLKRKRDEDKK